MYRSESVAAATVASSVIRTWWCASYRSRRPRRIAIVSSTDGSGTRIGWKRRSKAGSFSMCLRYSSTVVAPTTCSSPRARAGLSMLPASIEPSAAPAPTTVWSSSMNTITSRSAAVTSSITPLRRSSNSPRYLLPATIPARSRAITSRSFRVSGTSPLTIRWARPSTMAVLPTPGSPMSTGLFFVRRDSTSRVCSTSLSRPTTGSRRPSRAAAVRSRPYSSNVGVLDCARPDRAGPSAPAGLVGLVGRTASVSGSARASSLPATDSVFAPSPSSRCSGLIDADPAPRACR